LVRAWPVVTAWLGRAHAVGGGRALSLPDATTLDVAEYWFWPRLADATTGGIVEPDLIISLAGFVAIVEAKYYSGKGGRNPKPEPALTAADAQRIAVDQLVREWRACDAGAGADRCEPSLRDALRSDAPRALFYLVRRNRWHRELRAAEESSRQAPEARIFLLTWEDLDDVLAGVGAAGSIGTGLVAAPGAARWIDELRRYLNRRDVAAFRGFRAVVSTQPSVSALVARPPWLSARASGWDRTTDTARAARFRALTAWRSDPGRNIGHV
ncbi:MAG TPA: hypothetical protein VHE35_20390, partial [Kofleriaceae bacterium]|nr:hypothetical protein [Kofleriaceae bacterium]